MYRDGEGAWISINELVDARCGRFKDKSNSKDSETNNNIQQCDIESGEFKQRCKITEISN